MCGATIVSRADELQESDIGTACGLFEIRKFGDEYVLISRGYESVCTLGYCNTGARCCVAVSPAWLRLALASDHSLVLIMVLDARAAASWLFTCSRLFMLSLYIVL